MIFKPVKTAGLLKVPDSLSLSRALELTANSPEAAAYLQTRFSARMIACGLDQNPEIKTLMADVSRYATQMQALTAVGESPVATDIKPPTTFVALQSTIVTESIHALGKHDVDFYYELDENAAIKCLFDSHDEAGLSSKDEAKLNELFTAWVGSESMMIKKGILYEASDKGEPKKDKNGHDIRVQSETLRSKLDKFSSFIQEKQGKAGGLTVNVVHPEQEPTQTPG
jgi:hypothetical protein